MRINEHQYSIRDRAECERGDSSVRLQNRPCGRASGNVYRLSAELTGSIVQQGFSVHLWKVVSSNSETDSLVKMAMQESEIAGFWIE